MTSAQAQRLADLTAQLSETLMTAAICAGEIRIVIRTELDGRTAVPTGRSQTGKYRNPPRERPLVDDSTLSVLWAGKICPLRRTILFRLAERLARRPNQYITAGQLLRDVWEGGVKSPDTIRSTVRHPDIAAALDQGTITRTCAVELTHVKPARQQEILTAMKGYKDFSVAFARSLILKTPPAQREARRGRKHNPWDRSAQRKNDLLKKLAEPEHKHDFYSRLYKQYTIDLLRLAIYARSLLSNIRVREYLV